LGIERYIQAAGFQTDAPEAIVSWNGLRAWLNNQPQRMAERKIRRSPAAPGRFDLSVGGAVRRKFSLARPNSDDRRKEGWEPIAAKRQRVALMLAVLSTVTLLTATYFVLERQQVSVANHLLHMVVYGAMTFFLASIFWKTILGTYYRQRGRAGTPWHPIYTARDLKPDTRIAIVYPIFHEDVSRVAAGMAATWESLAGAHKDLAACFDFFLLSDSNRPEFAISESAAISALARHFPQARFYYRRRMVNSNAKLGNIEDFCRRWGGDYRYMLVMDADSIMDGEAIIELARMMEGSDRIGIVQTKPRPVMRASLFGRMHQFAARLYGSFFATSAMVMNLGSASYLGHNAMIRIEPFIRHCFLPTLPGSKPWGGKPLSHDIVESAMMARAGYEVWFLPEIEGTYEEVPSNILAFLVRERRWMQGNLQHLRFIFMPGLRSIHRETFLNGSLGYIAAPLWASFLILSTYAMLQFLATGLTTLGDLSALKLPALFLSLSVFIFLFVPRILALLIHIDSAQAWRFGGKAKLMLSVAAETMFSVILSPIIMIFMTYFFWLWLRRKTISWGSQPRGDEPLPWKECIRHFGWVSVVGLVALALLIGSINSIPERLGLIMEYMSGGWARADYLLYWLSPILFGLIAAPWIARFTSLSYPGIRRAKFFCVPEEIDMPPVVRSVRNWQRKFSGILPDPENRKATLDYGFSDPYFYVAHRGRTRLQPRLARQLLYKIAGDESLNDGEMLRALGERQCFDLIHEKNASQMNA
jgi:membrane glycosyltransferase